ncbi:MAG: M3 family metallopeptidase [Bacteroidales bacterium]|nr:M3 family metallopeptidase [Bacteroidales bacterium]
MKKLAITAMASLALASCGNGGNPLIEGWDTPYSIPPFDQIRAEHFVPAFKAGIEQQKAEIAAIVANPDAPTFENTIVPFDLSGEILSRAAGVLFNLENADGTDEIIAAVEEITPMLSDFSSDIYMDSALYARVAAVYEQRESLEREQQMLVKKIYDSFAANGISLDDEGKARMKELNSEISVLGNKFGTNLLAENNAFAERFGIGVSEYEETMAATEDRAKREEMFMAYSSRGNNGNEYDNKELCVKLLRLRNEKAKLLGYDCAASYILSNRMAQEPAAVDTFLEGIMSHSLKKAREEVEAMQEFMDADIAAGLLPDGSVIQPWDWAYYAEKVRQARYALDENQTKPYFQMEKVRQGVFDNASRMYGLNFSKIEGTSLYHPEAEAFEVKDSDGSYIGVIITDYFPRSTKRGGAWMENVVDQFVDADGSEQRPVIVNVGNFAKPVDGKPSLLTIDQVGTLFHEFGHALHGLLSRCHYKGISGTNVARDFVELPSQFNENWAFCKEILGGYALHYETGEVIPDSLITKINNAGTFNQGFLTTELAAASVLDMKLHELKDIPEDFDILAFENRACAEMGLINEIIPRYRTTYFNHIFNSGYHAGYYSYLWAEVLDKDAFEFFRQKGILDGETAMSFRRNILERGGSEEPMTLYRNFRGQDPDPEALLKARGLK